MVRSRLGALLFSIFFSTCLLAKTEPKKYAVSFNLQPSLSILQVYRGNAVSGVTEKVSGAFAALFEFPLSPKLTFVAPVFVSFGSGIGLLKVQTVGSALLQDVRPNYITAGLGAGIRYYISNKAFEDGWYFDSLVKFSYNSGGFSSEFSSRIGGFEAAIQSNIGYLWVFDSGLTLNAAAGAEGSFLMYQNKKQTKNVSSSFFGIVPLLSFGVGYTW